MRDGMSDDMSVRLDSVERAIVDIAAGRAVVVVDDEDRENEGDIIFAAAKARMKSPMADSLMTRTFLISLPAISGAPPARGHRLAGSQRT